jgi:hypothetical protein
VTLTVRGLDSTPVRMARTSPPSIGRNTFVGPPPRASPSVWGRLRACTDLVGRAASGLRERDCSWQNTTHLVRELQLAHTCGSTSGSTHARGRSSMVGAPVRLPPRTRVTTLHTSLNQRIQSTEPSGATSSPSAQGRARRVLEDAIRAGGVVCVIFVVRSPAPRLPRGSLVAPGRERRGRRM